jgi:hypothetical protein
MSSGEKVGQERIAAQKEAIVTLKKLIDDHGFEEGFRSFLTVTLRKWNGMVATEEGNWIEARFEFSRGRTVAETHDPGSLPWFDAAIMETEVWSALTSTGLTLEALGELAQRLDQVSTLYAAGSDRSNAEFTSDWGQWLKVFIDSAVPPPGLSERILSYVEARTPKGEPGAELPVREVPLAKDAFEWNYFWFSRLAREAEASLKDVFDMVDPLEALARGAAVLAAPPSDFGLLLRLNLSKERETPPPESPAQLLERIQSDLQRLQRVENDSREYVSEVRRLWDSSPKKKKEEVVQAIHPGRKWRP